MHRKQDSDLLPVDIELERTLRSLRKTKRAENVAMEDERHDRTEEQRTTSGRPPITDTMEDFWRHVIQEEYSAIRQPTVNANNLETKSSFDNNGATASVHWPPYRRPQRAPRMENTVKLNGVRPEVIKLHLFPFSLRDIAATWYESLPYGSVDTWEELVEAYLGKFFPPSLTSKRRREIIVFALVAEEVPYAWN